MRVYLAGPEVFLPNALAVLEEKVRICRAHKLQGVPPIDGSQPAPSPTREGALAISRNNEELMRGCDLVIANMTPFRGPSMDVGTAFEMGFMRALGRTVLGYSNVDDGLLERTVALCQGARSPTGWTDPLGMTIEDFGLGDNLMVDGAVLTSKSEVIRQTTDDAARFIDLTAFARCVEEAARLVDTGTIRGRHSIR